MKTNLLRLWAGALLAVASMHAGALLDPVLVAGPEAIDPETGPNAGLQNITVRAEGAPTKEALLRVPGFAVLQTFTGFEGAMNSPVNRVDFSDGRPSITFTLNSTTGYGGVGVGDNPKTAYTSGEESPKQGVAVYIGSTMNDSTYTIEFSQPVAAVGFTISRRLATTGANPNWTATYFGPGGNLLERQSAMPSHAENVAALFGYIAKEGAPVSKVVFGKLDRATKFIMGSENIFLDDLGFAPLRRAGVLVNPTLAEKMGGDGGETIDIQASGASPRSFLERIDGLGVVQDWTGFAGIATGEREVTNIVDFAQGLDFRFRLQAQGDGAEGSGAMTEDKALTVSPKQALLIGGKGGMLRLEIAAGLYEETSGTFKGDASVYAMGFVVSNRAGGELVATFYNQAGEVLSVQSGAGTEDPDNANNPNGRRGAEIYFGWIANSKDDVGRWIHRVRIDDRGSEAWGLDDFAFVASP